MNYTTLEKVKSALGTTETTDDTLLEEKIAEASRAIDRICGAPDNYFELVEDVAGETLTGNFTAEGSILCYPAKAIVNSVASFEYRRSPLDEYSSVEPAYVAVSSKRMVEAFAESIGRGKCFIRVDYSGGYGTEEPAVPAVPADPDADPPVEETPRVPAVITGLPEDIINAATVLSIRFYKEEKSGLTDAIGVAELGTMQYTKAYPARVVEMLKPYKRIL